MALANGNRYFCTGIYSFYERRVFNSWMDLISNVLNADIQNREDFV
jgi:hypothetical protein